MLERTVQALITWAGGAIGFFSGDPLRLLEDLQTLRPTRFPSVPRVLNRIKERVETQVAQASGVTQRLYAYALSQKATNGVFADLLDFIVLRKIRNTLGFDRLRNIVTGSAPICPFVLTWLRTVLNAPVLEAYGMTECTLVATMQAVNDLSTGNVGGPLSSIEMRLVDVPEMGYKTTDKKHEKIDCVGRGEIWIRGPTVFKGYYKMPAETSEAIMKTGWLKTGDIGVWLHGGQLKIVDRKKNIFKLSNGEYVSGEKVESIITQSKFVQQSFVYGNSFQRLLVALVVLNPEALQNFVKPCEKLDEDMLNKNESLKKAVLADIHKVSVANKLLGFEIIKNVHLLVEPWTPANFLTPTFKLKRNEVSKHYISALDGLYAQLNNAVSKL
jgi:long-chain acyl-CoA synthetase